MRQYLFLAVLFGLALAPVLADAANTCGDSHVPVERSNGDLVCLTEKTAEKAAERFGWVIIDTPTQPDVEDSTGADKTLQIDSDNETAQDPVSNQVEDKATHDAEESEQQNQLSPPRTGTVHFKDLKRIKNPDDVYMRATDRDDQLRMAQFIADVFGATAVHDEEISSKSVLLDSDGNEIGQTRIYSLYASADKSQGDFIGSNLKSISMYDVGMDCCGPVRDYQDDLDALDEYYEGGDVQHQPRLDWMADFIQKINPSSKKYPDLDFTINLKPGLYTSINNKTLVEKPIIGYNGGFGDRYKTSYPGMIFTFWNDHPGVDIEHRAILTQESRDKIQEYINARDSGDTEYGYYITYDEALDIIIDFASTSRILNEPDGQCEIELYSREDLRRTMHFGFIDGVPVYTVIPGDCRGEDGIAHDSYFERVGSNVYYHPDGYKLAPQIIVDGWTGDFINISGQFGRCHGYDEDTCKILVANSGVFEAIKTEHGWCVRDYCYDRLRYYSSDWDRAGRIHIPDIAKFLPERRQ